MRNTDPGDPNREKVVQLLDDFKISGVNGTRILSWEEKCSRIHSVCSILEFKWSKITSLKWHNHQSSTRPGSFRNCSSAFMFVLFHTFRDSRVFSPWLFLSKMCVWCLKCWDIICSSGSSSLTIRDCLSPVWKASFGRSFIYSVWMKKRLRCLFLY